MGVPVLAPGEFLIWGAIGGAAIEAATQYALEGEVDLKRVAVAAAVGAFVPGGLGNAAKCVKYFRSAKRSVERFKKYVKTAKYWNKIRGRERFGRQLEKVRDLTRARRELERVRHLERAARLAAQKIWKRSRGEKISSIHDYGSRIWTASASTASASTTFVTKKEHDFRF